jgi:hypothetical protein
VIDAADAIGKMKTAAIGLVDRFRMATEVCSIQKHDLNLNGGATTTSEKSDLD